MNGDTESIAHLEATRHDLEVGPAAVITKFKPQGELLGGQLKVGLIPQGSPSTSLKALALFLFSWAAPALSLKWLVSP